MRSCSGGGTLVSLCKGATFSRSRCVFHVFTTTSIKMEVKHTVFPHFQRPHSYSNKIYFSPDSDYLRYMGYIIVSYDEVSPFELVITIINSPLWFLEYVRFCATQPPIIVSVLEEVRHYARNNHSAYRRNRRNQGKGTKLFANYSA